MTDIHEALKPLAVDIDSLTPDPSNARKHDKRNIEAIKASLARFGQTKPIVLHANGTTIIAGNGTWYAAKELGWTHIAAAKTSLDTAEAVAYGIADNRTAELAEWDMEVLDKLTANLDEDLVEAAGFLDAELDRLLAKDTDRGTADHDKGMSRSEEDYANDTIKTFIVYLSLDQHAELVKKLDEVIKEEDLLSHGEAILHLAGIQLDEDD